MAWPTNPSWGGDWKDFRDRPHFQMILATPAEQTKIIKGQYPLYDQNIEKELAKLISLYEKIKGSNYSKESLKAFISYFDCQKL